MHSHIAALFAATALCAIPAVAQSDSGTTHISGATSGEDSDGTINVGSSSSSGDCPSGQLNAQLDGQTYCCPGTVFEDDGNRFCCVGAKFEVATPSFASCFPTCTGSDGATEVATSTQSCATSIFFTDSDYSSLASAAAVSLSSSGSGSGSSSASTTGTDDSSSGSNSAAQASATNDSNESSASSEGSAAMITSGPILGGLVAAGGIVMAL